ncbi:MAG: hypothetical protein U5K37_00530 [Natrialbaceae archaeon]|nr:hypothetical protein [Natrialbaceae archaeon]
MSKTGSVAGIVTRIPITPVSIFIYHQMERRQRDLSWPASHPLEVISTVIAAIEQRMIQLWSDGD